MDVFRKVGKGIGTVGGGIIGGSVKLAGKAVGTKWKETGEWMEDVGDSMQAASKIALNNAGQFLDGTVQGTYGVIKKDDYYKEMGLNNLKDSTTNTIKGIGSAIKYTATKAGATVKGFSTGNQQQGIEGLKNLGKVVAVSTLAIGVIDLIEGADVVEAESLETKNDHLNGFEHPETGVPFVEKVIDLPNGQVVEGTFPVFESDFNVVLSEEVYLESDHIHFNIANDTLYQAISQNPNIANELGLSSTDVQGLANGQTPDGYTWHHNEEPGVLQLVDEDTHAQTAHTGGRTIWGGGSEYR